MQFTTSLNTNSNDPKNNFRVTPYDVIPVGVSVHVLKSRILPAFAFLLTLRRAYPGMTAKVTMQELIAVGHESGLKDARTIHKYLEVLEKHNFLRFKNGHLHLWSLRKHSANTFRRGIRVFTGMDLRQTFFAGIIAVHIRYNQRKKRSLCTNKVAGKHGSFLSDGLSLNYLSTLLKLSIGRVSRMKRNPYLTVKHRLELSNMGIDEFRFYRNQFPSDARKFKVIGSNVFRQLQDKIDVHSLEFSRLRAIA